MKNVENVLKISLSLSQNPNAKKVLERALENEVYTKEYFEAKMRLHAQNDVVTYCPTEVAMEAGWEI